MQKVILDFTPEQNAYAKKACEFGKPADKCKTAIAIITIESSMCQFKRSIKSTEPLVMGEDFGCWGINTKTALNMMKKGIIPPNVSIKTFRTEAHELSYMQSRLMDSFNFESYFGLAILEFWYINRNKDLRSAVRGYHAGYKAFKWSNSYDPLMSASADRYAEKIWTIFRALKLNNDKALRSILDE